MGKEKVTEPRKSQKGNLFTLPLSLQTFCLSLSTHCSQIQNFGIGLSLKFQFRSKTPIEIQNFDRIHFADSADIAQS